MTKRLRDPAAIELPLIDEDPRYAQAFSELRALDERRAESEGRKKILRARLRGEQPTRSLLERAAALLKGAQVTPIPPEAEFMAVTEEIEILHEAQQLKRQEIAKIRSELSLEACQRFTSLLNESHEATLEALEALHRALEVGRVIRARLVAGGYELSEWALPSPRPSRLANGNYSAAMATDINIFSLPGDPYGHSHTPAGRFRDWLRERGIV